MTKLEKCHGTNKKQIPQHLRTRTHMKKVGKIKKFATQPKTSHGKTKRVLTKLKNVTAQTKIQITQHLTQHQNKKTRQNNVAAK